MGRFIEIVSENEKIPMEVGESTIYYRRFDTSEHDKIRKKWTSKAGRTRDGTPIYETDEKEVNNELLDGLIVGWKNVKDPITGKDVECTKENKIKLPVDIRLDLIDRAGAKDTKRKETEEAEKKTSKNTPTS